ncbi:MAG: SGNH/GDSL hydrolase family protein [Pseudobutyrivibrio sp.]|uniref:SGNH/GDSL hydrolase family protein n=1 Tax=Pseudobutyrivibrio sp. TaxID=2014367 RepID=UPI0025E4FE32|nr:SGNH/GDSL hydrolase family protein [Pseudobutyrivibrio sp.]MBE5905067.1 SGNH/GDSL hydrolase family protein [Pseudobutyrivibrio sp.]
MKKLLAIVLTIVITISGLWFATRLFMPKYMHGILEGAMIGEYYDDPTDHNVVFIGDCELYENISPVYLWENFGINSYIRGSAQQLIWQSYYLAEETVEREHPDVIVFNVLSMKYNTPQNEAYNRMTLDGMKWSSSKVDSIKASMTEEESMIEYMFPLLRYHSRWSDLNADDFKYLFQRDKVTFNGYYMRVDEKPADDNIPKGRPIIDYQFGDTAYQYLDKLTKLCKDNGIELILVKAPSLFPYWYPQWDKQIEDYAAANDLTYINFLDYQDSIGLDWDKDTYDGGLHLNLSGAEKLSEYFGQILSNDFNVPDRRGEEDLEKYWDGVIERYDAEIQRQTTNLEKYGSVHGPDGE